MSTSKSISDVDSKAETALIEMSRERRKYTEALTEERERMMEEIHNLEKKNIASKVSIYCLFWLFSAYFKNLMMIMIILKIGEGSIFRSGIKETEREYSGSHIR